MVSSRSILGPLCIAIAAALWATDALFRLPSTTRLAPIMIVASEHLIALIVLWPIMWLRHRGRLTQLTRSQWVSVAFIGVGASAIATVLFTTSFRYINPSVAILLQKLQPIFVALLAISVLRERPARGFYRWAVVAFFSALVLNFPDLGFSFLNDLEILRSRGAVYALSAAIIWALATVVGKALLRTLDFEIATFWRFFFGFSGLAAMIVVSGISVPYSELSQREVWQPLVYMAIVPGLLAMLFYYKGLARTPASTVTMVELIFPVSAVALNTIYLSLPLQPVQIGAGAVLLLAVTRIAFLR